MKYYLTLIGLLLLSCNNVKSNKDLGDKTIVKNEIKTSIDNRINTYLDALAKNGFSGSVLIEKDNEIILSKGYNTNHENTIYDIGSVTKQFTGAAILKLEEQGKLSVTDKLSTFFSTIPNDKKNITIHQLLTHSAGFSDAFGDDYETLKKGEFINRFSKLRLKYTPGTKHIYSNIGYSILTVIIENITNLSYDEFLKKEFFTPLLMKSSGYLVDDKENISSGYLNNKVWGKPNQQNWDIDGPYWNLRGNGGILSTTKDLYKWHRALLANEILSEKSKKKYFKRHIKEGENASSYYGYGWAIFNTPRNTTLIAHNGGNGIYFADFLRYTEDDVTIILLTNNAEKTPESLAFQLAKIIFDSTYVPVIKKEVVSQSFPNNIKGQLGEKFMKIIHSSDTDTKENFINTHYSDELIALADMKSHESMLSQIKAELGGFEISKVTQGKGMLKIHVTDGIINKTLYLGFSHNNKIEGINIED